MKLRRVVGIPCGKHRPVAQRLVAVAILLTLFSSYYAPSSRHRLLRLLPSALSLSSSSPLPASYHPLPQSLSPPPPAPAEATPAGCDLSKGRWVWNPRGPYYTNRTCREIQEHQNCMKYGRPDRGFLHWRWKPDGCELPAFDPAEFLRLVRGRSLAFVGDSLARNQMQSLVCLLSPVESPQDVSHTSDQNFRRLQYGGHNFNLSIFWSPFLVRAEEGRLPGLPWSGLWSLYLDEPDPAWAAQVAAFDFVVVSGGNWFTRPALLYEGRRLVGSNYYLRRNITELTLHYANRKAFRTALRAVNRGRLRRRSEGAVLVRTLSPSHFEGGEWDRGGDCARTRPSRGDEAAVMMPMEARLYEEQVAEYRRAEEKGRRKGVRFGLLDATGAMVRRPDGHPSRYGHWPEPEGKVTLHNDCVHWCLPGPVDLWNELLLQMVKGASTQKSF